MTAVFRKAWSQLWQEISPVASMYGERVIEESIEMLSLSSSRESSAATATRMQQQRQQHAPYGRNNNIAAIDENSVFQNDSVTLYDDYFYAGAAADNDPVSLPNLGRYRPVCVPFHDFEPSFSTMLSAPGCFKCAASKGHYLVLGPASSLCLQKEATRGASEVKITTQ